MPKLVVRALGLAMALLIVVASPTASRSDVTVPITRATLDGQLVALSVAAQHHCHDLIPGQLTCFSSEVVRDAAAAGLMPLTGTASDAEVGPDSSGGYVIAWVDATYAGASVILTQDYDDLRTIGWNDRISSYKVYTNLTGAFHTDIHFSGGYQLYCCFAQVSYVGDHFNDTFSSFELP